MAALYEARATSALAVLETTMRLLCAAALVIAFAALLGARPATAAIRITDSIYQSGTLIVAGQVQPHKKVILDGKYVTQADDGGRFEFKEPYKPETCMSSITTDEDSYSAVITNCLLGDAAAATDNPAPHRAVTTDAP
jgi:hypothetical protein